MTGAEVLFACVLSLLDPRGMPMESCENNAEAVEIADAIENATVGTGIPKDTVAADIWHESNYNKRAIGTKGEVGLMQVKRGGAVQGAYAKMTNAQLSNISLNIYLGVSYMAQKQQKCSWHWLTKYNRPANGCRPSKYSRGVAEDLKLGQSLLRRLMTSKLTASS